MDRESSDLEVTRRHLLRASADWLCCSARLRANGRCSKQRKENRWTSNETDRARRPKRPRLILPARSAWSPCFRWATPVRLTAARHLRARRTHRMAYASARPDPDHHGRSRLGADRRRTDRRNPAGRCGVVSARREALARRNADHRHDAYRGAGIAQRQECRLDGEGQRRAIQQVAVTALGPGCVKTPSML